MHSDAQREKSIFLAAVDQTPEECLAYLDAACAGEPALRARVEVLLRAHRGADHLFDQSGPDPAGTVEEPAGGVHVGTVIGPYRVMEQLGEGGMGLVFVAEQQQPVRRKVALKVIKPGMDTRQVVARFEAERQALALMDHPNIAQVFDGGATAAGRPYFVMELVKGAPITDYCDANCLALRQRLELFVKVCQAVQHAHQKGIIHRDLKPSNVLVASHDGTPVVKVIDFGIAKAVGQQLTDKTVYTQVSQLVGTPLYMSPEQAGQSALDVDTRSDVYSLGVLLYELLIGTTPFGTDRFRNAGHDEVRRIIREEEPPRPSARLSTLGPAAATVSSQRRSEVRRLAALCRGELDWIVMKCLEKDRARRYATANGLALDVQRYLNDEQVHACPPSAWYRAHKFTRRHRVGLAVAGLVLLFLVLLGSGSGWVARDYTARQAAIEREVARALVEAKRFQTHGKYPDALAAARRAEGMAAVGGSLETWHHVQDRRADLEMVGRLEKLRLRRFELKGGDSDYAGVDHAFTEAFREYGVDIEALSPESAAAWIRARTIPTELAVALDDWGEARRQARPGDLLLARLLEIARAVDPDDWRDRLRAAVWARDRQGLKDLATAADVAAVPASTQAHLGAVLDAMGERAAAVRLLRAAQAQHPDDFWINFALGMSLGWLQPAEWDEAARCFAMAVALRPTNPIPHGCLGWALLSKGSVGPSVTALRRAVDLDAHYFDAQVLLAQGLARLGKWDEAIAAHRKSLALRPDNAWAVSNLIDTGLKAGRPEQAVAALEEGVRRAPDHLEARTSLARALTALGKCDAAYDHYTRAIGLCRAPNDLKQLWRERAFLDARRGWWAKAAAAYTKLLNEHPEMLEDHLAVSHYCDHAFLLLLAADGGGYRRVCERLLDRFERSPNARSAFHVARVGAMSPHVGIDPQRLVDQAEQSVAVDRTSPAYLHALGLAYHRAGRHKDALERLQESLRDKPPWSSQPANWVALALVYQHLGQAAEARRHLDKFDKWMDLSANGMRYLWGGFPLHPHDWMDCLILRREADALLAPADRPAPRE